MSTYPGSLDQKFEMIESLGKRKGGVAPARRKLADMVNERMLPTPHVEAAIVEVEDIICRPTTVNLANGSVLRLSQNVIEVHRFDRKWGRDGKRICSEVNGSVMNGQQSPEILQGSNCENVHVPTGLGAGTWQIVVLAANL